MRKMTWIRWGLASVILAVSAMATLAAGCSDDETTTPPKTDSGKDQGTPDVVVPETGGETGTDASRPNAKVVAINAITELPNGSHVRICFATGPNDDGSGATISPLPAPPSRDAHATAK